ncbi:MAG TPA: tetratricopeptide repeat protein, partial [Ignavibacteriaceae bacterium]
MFALDSASILNGIGIVNYQMSEFEESLKNLNTALRIRERILSRSHYLTADIYGNIGMVYVSYAEPEIASDMYEKALNTRIKVFGEKSI